MLLKTEEWGLLLDRPALRATLEALPGYAFSPSARQALCQAHQLTAEQLAHVLQLYGRHYRPGRRSAVPGRPVGPAPRDGLDLLLQLVPLRQLLDAERLAPVLDAASLRQRFASFQLSPREYAGVLTAHADLWQRT